MSYIETRPEAIKAIHKCIQKKWNPICMGCAKEWQCSCELCCKFQDKNDKCDRCPLFRSGNGCNQEGSSWSNYQGADDTCVVCEKIRGEEYCTDNSGCPGYTGNTIKLYSANEAEAMLEALVMILPKPERKQYGG